eukprot:s1245_g11.t1
MSKVDDRLILSLYFEPFFWLFFRFEGKMAGAPWDGWEGEESSSNNLGPEMAIDSSPGSPMLSHGKRRRSSRRCILLGTLVTCIWLHAPCFAGPKWPSARSQGARTQQQALSKDFSPHGAAMFAAGALLGPALDGVSHGNFGEQWVDVLG